MVLKHIWFFNIIFQQIRLISFFTFITIQMCALLLTVLFQNTDWWVLLVLFPILGKNSVCTTSMVFYVEHIVWKFWCRIEPKKRSRNILKGGPPQGTQPTGCLKWPALKTSYKSHYTGTTAFIWEYMHIYKYIYLWNNNWWKEVVRLKESREGCTGRWRRERRRNKYCD